MSTIKTETLSTPSNATVPVDTVVNGTAKAWVNFNGTGTVAIRRAFNVSSITDNGNGDFTVNFTTAMPDANYSIGQSVKWGNAGSMAGSFGVGWVEIARRTDALQTGSVRVWGTYPTDQTLYNRETVCIQVFS